MTSGPQYHRAGASKGTSAPKITSPHTPPELSQVGGLDGRDPLPRLLGLICFSLLWPPAPSLTLPPTTPLTILCFPFLPWPFLPRHLGDVQPPHWGKRLELTCFCSLPEQMCEFLPLFQEKPLLLLRLKKK